MKGIKILSFGKYVGEKQVTNHDFESIINTTDEWIRTRTGIEARHFSNISMVDMATHALKQALDQAKMPAEALDVIIVATTTTDQLMPTLASSMIRNLNISKKCIAYDMNVACSGFVFALDVASLYMNNKDEINNVAVIGIDKYSNVIDFQDRNTCVLFGDAAGAIILQKTEKKNVFPAMLETLSDKNNILSLTHLFDNQTNPFFAKKEQNQSNFLHMKGQEVFKFAIKAVSDQIKDYIKQYDLDIEKIDYIVCHQANMRILQALARQLKIAEDKFFANLQKYGNTGAASIPLALAEMKEFGLINQGTKLLCVGFGGGLSCGTIYVEFE